MSRPSEKVERLMKKRIEDASLAELEEAVAYIDETEAAQSPSQQRKGAGKNERLRMVEKLGYKKHEGRLQILRKCR